MPLPPFLDALRSRVLVCDGAMGTLLYAQGRLHQSLLRVAQPHPARPGRAASIASTCAPAPTSSRPTRSARTAMKLRGVRPRRPGARDQPGRRPAGRAGPPARRAYVAGAIGPLGVRDRALGQDRRRRGASTTSASRPRRWSRAASTCSSSRPSATGTKPAPPIAAVRAVCTLPIVAQMTTEEDGNSLDGTPPEQFAPALARARRRRGRRQLQRRARRRCSRPSNASSAVCDVPLSAQPNAGKPRDIEGRNIYLCSPEYMASYARRFIASGVRLVGGCCGTTPEHIRQIAPGREAAGAGRGAPRRSAPARRHRARPPTRSRPVPQAQKSRLGAALASGRFVHRRGAGRRRAGTTRRTAVAQARALAERGVDVVTILDGPAAGARMSATVAGRADSPAVGPRDPASVLVPRPQPAGHPVRPARRARDGPSQRAGHHRGRRASSATIPTRPRSSTSTRSGSPM